MADCESIKNFNNIICDEYSCKINNEFIMNREVFNKCLKNKMKSETIDDHERYSRQYRKSPKRDTWFHRRSPKRS